MRRLHLAAAIAALAIGSTTQPSLAATLASAAAGAVDGVAEDDLTVLKAFPDIAKSVIRRAYALTES